MKHAVMIMAHKNPNQVIRLISVLNCESFDFYVHFDSDFALSENDISKIKNAGGGITFISARGEFTESLTNGACRKLV